MVVENKVGVKQVRSDYTGPRKLLQGLMHLLRNETKQKLGLSRARTLNKEKSHHCECGLNDRR